MFYKICDALNGEIDESDDFMLDLEDEAGDYTGEER